MGDVIEWVVGQPGAALVVPVARTSSGPREATYQAGKDESDAQHFPG